MARTQYHPDGIATAVYFLAMGLHEIGQTPLILAQQIDGPCPEGIPTLTLQDVPWRQQGRLRARFGDVDQAVQRQVAHGIAEETRSAVRTHATEALVMEETNGWAAMVAEQIPVPVIVTLHGPWVLHKALQSNKSQIQDARREACEARTFQNAAGLISPSHEALKAVENTVLPADKPRTVLANALETPPGHAIAAERAGHDILFVGRFDLHKGADTVLSAFSLVSETHPHARLTFVGPDKGLREPDGQMLPMQQALARLPDAVRTRIDYKGTLPTR